MNHRDAVAALGLPPDANWLQIEAALATESRQLQAQLESEGPSAATQARSQQLREIRLTLYGPLGNSAAFASLLDGSIADFPVAATEFASPATAPDPAAAQDIAASSQATAAAPAESHLSPTNYVRGAMVRRYQLDQRLQQTSAFSVWLANDTQRDKPVLIKCFHYSVAPDAQSQLLDELATLRSLRGSNLGEILDFWIQDNRLSIAWKRPTGDLLREKMNAPNHEDRQFEVRRTTAIIDQLCGAMNAVHAKLKPFGGLSPESIWIDSDDAITVDLTCGSLFRRFQLLGETREGVWPPPYLAPEERSAESRAAQQASQRADQYSLAAIAYELTAGRTSQETKKPLHDVCSAPLAFSEAIKRALSNDPARRFRTLDDFRRACIVKRRTSPLSLWLAPTAAAALVLCLSCAYLQHLDPSLRTRHFEARAEQIGRKARTAHEHTLKPWMDRTRKTIHSLDQAANRVQNDLAAANLQPVARLKAVEHHFWQTKLAANKESAGAEITPESQIANWLKEADLVMQQARRLRVAQQYRAAQASFAQAERNYGAIASMTADGDANEKTASQLVSFYEAWEKLAQQEFQLLNALASYHALRDGLTKLYSIRHMPQGESAVVPAIPDNQAAELQARREEFAALWGESQREFKKLTDRLCADDRPVTAPSMQHELTVFAQRHQAVLDQLEAFRAAFFAAATERIGQQRAAAEQELNQALKQLDELDQRVSEASPRLAELETGRTWLTAMLHDLHERCHDYRLKVGHCERNFKLVIANLQLVNKPGDDARKVEWLQQAQTTSHEVEHSAEELSGEIACLLVGTEDLPVLAKQQGSLQETVGKVADREIQWWRGVQDSEAIDHHATATENIRRLSSAKDGIVGQLTKLDVIAANPRPYSPRGYEDELLKLKRTSLSALNQWESAANQSAEQQKLLIEKATKAVALSNSDYVSAAQKVKDAMAAKETALAAAKSKLAALNQEVEVAKKSAKNFDDKKQQEVVYQAQLRVARAYSTEYRYNAAAALESERQGTAAIKEREYGAAETADELRRKQKALSDCELATLKLTDSVERLLRTYQNLKSDQAPLVEQVRQYLLTPPASGIDVGRALHLADRLHLVNQAASEAVDLVVVYELEAPNLAPASERPSLKKPATSPSPWPTTGPPSYAPSTGYQPSYVVPQRASPPEYAPPQNDNYYPTPFRQHP